MVNHPNRSQANIVDLYSIRSNRNAGALEVFYDHEHFACGFRLTNPNNVKSDIVWLQNGMMPGLAVALNSPIPNPKKESLEDKVERLEKELTELRDVVTPKTKNVYGDNGNDGMIEYRLSWIKGRFDVSGKITRDEVMDRFRVSESVASSLIKDAIFRWPAMSKLTTI